MELSKARGCVPARGAPRRPALIFARDMDGRAAILLLKERQASRVAKRAVIGGVGLLTVGFLFYFADFIDAHRMWELRVGRAVCVDTERKDCRALREFCAEGRRGGPWMRNATSRRSSSVLDTGEWVASSIGSEGAGFAVLRQLRGRVAGDDLVGSMNWASDGDLRSFKLQLSLSVEIDTI